MADAFDLLLDGQKPKRDMFDTLLENPTQPDYEGLSGPSGPLTVGERPLASWEMTAMEGWDVFKNSVRGGALKFAESITSATDTILRYTNPSTFAFNAASGGKARTALGDASLYFRDWANKTAPDYGTEGAKYHTYNAITSVIQNVPAVAVGIATGGGALWPMLMMGGNVGGEKYNELKERGFSEERALMGGTAYGLAEAIGEVAPFIKLMKFARLGGVGALVKWFIAEQLGEQATEHIDMAIDVGLLDENITLNDYLKRVKDVAIITGISMPILAGTGRVMGKGTQMYHDRKAKTLSVTPQIAPTTQGETLAPTVTPPTVTEPAPAVTVKSETVLPDATEDLFTLAEGDATMTEEQEAEYEYFLAKEGIIEPVTLKKGPGEPTETVPAAKPEGGIRESLVSALQNASSGESIGLRVPTSPSAIYGREYAAKMGLPWSEEIAYKVGDRLGPSYKWVDDVPIGKQYKGTSVIQVTPQNIDQAIALIQKYPNADQLLIVKGRRIGKAGNDQGEIFLSDPEVVSVHRFSDLPNPSRPPGEGGQKKPIPLAANETPTKTIDLDPSSFVSEETGRIIDNEGLKSASVVELVSLMEYTRNLMQRLASVKEGEAIFEKTKATLASTKMSYSTIKQLIREKTGQIKIDSLVKESDALNAAFKKAEQASRVAFKEGKRAGIDEMKQIMLAQRNNRAVQNEARKLLKWIDTMSKKIDKKASVPPEYRDVIKAVLLNYDGAALDGLINSDPTLMMDYDRVELLQATTTRENLSLDELRNIVSIGKSLIYQGRAGTQIIKANERVAFNDVRDEMLKQVGLSPPLDGKPPEVEVRPGEPIDMTKQGAHSKLQNVMDLESNLVKAEYIVQQMDGWQREGPWWRHIFLPSVEADDINIRNSVGIIGELRAAIDIIRAKLPQIMGTKYTVAGDHNITLTKERAIAVYWNTLHENNLRNLKAPDKNGLAFTDRDIAAITGSLTAEEKQFADEIVKIVNDEGRFEAMARVYRKLTGERLTKVSGTYFPIVFDWKQINEMPQLKGIAKERDIKNMIVDVFSKAAIGRGMTIKRTERSQMPLRLDFGVVTDHLSMVNMFISHGLAVRNIAKLLSNGPIQGAVIEEIGPKGNVQLQNWIKGIANPTYDAMYGSSSFLSAARANMSLAILGYGFSAILSQPSAVFQSVRAIDREYGAGLWKTTAGFADFYRNPIENAKFLDSISPWLHERRVGFGSIMDSDKSWVWHEGELGVRLKNLAYMPMSIVDATVTYPTMWTVFNIEMARHGDFERAASWAEKVTRNTQGSTRAKDLAEVQRGSAFRRMLVPFYNYFSAQYNEMRRDVQMVKDGKAGYYDLAKGVFWLIMMQSAMGVLLKEREKLVEEGPLYAANKFGAGALSFAAGGVPMGSAIAGAIFEGWDFKPVPATKIIEEAGKVTKAISPIAEGDDIKWEQLMKHGALLSGYIMGIPGTRQFGLVADELWRVYDQGEDFDPANFVYKKPRN